LGGQKCSHEFTEKQPFSTFNLGEWQIDLERNDVVAGSSKCRLPVVDLWNWLKHKDSEQAISFLGEYMKITEPLITVGLGAKTISAICSRFKSSMDNPDPMYPSWYGHASFSPLISSTGLRDDYVDRSLTISITGEELARASTQPRQ
jgi:hypothetical protein